MSQSLVLPSLRRYHLHDHHQHLHHHHAAKTHPLHFLNSPTHPTPHFPPPIPPLTTTFTSITTSHITTATSTTEMTTFSLPLPMLSWTVSKFSPTLHYIIIINTPIIRTTCLVHHENQRLFKVTITASSVSRCHWNLHPGSSQYSLRIQPPPWDQVVFRSVQSHRETTVLPPFHLG